MAEEVFVHEGVVGFWMFARDANVFVLNDGQNALLAGDGVDCTMLKVMTSLKEISPFLCAWTRFL